MWLAFGALVRELRDGEVVVGCGADADWRVATADLMPRHFTLTVYGLNASLRPSSKDNVVAVNGRQLAGVPHLLNEGDVIEAGSGRFVFTEGPPVVSEQMPSEPLRGFLTDQATKSALALVNRSTTIGRDTSNTIVVTDPRASRFHAEIRREAGGFALHSMGAAGTLVNDRVLEWPCLLSDGDTIRIAMSTFRFNRSEPADASVAGLTASAGDARRRPTLTTAQVPVRAEDRDERLPALIRLAVAVAVAIAAIAWLLLRK